MSAAPTSSNTASSRPTAPRVAVMRDLCRALLAFSSQSAMLKLAEQAVSRYQSLDADERVAFFDILLNDFGPELTRVREAIERVSAESYSPTSLAQLFEASEARRQELFRRINTAPGGTAAMVNMRADLLAAMADRPEYRAVDADLEYLLRSWFNRGFLTLERISWESPAAVLEKLVEYEAVHAVRDWRDLRRRLGSDRRCYGFFHPALPGEPLIFIEIALTTGWATTIEAVLDAPSEAAQHASGEADTAIFYSITNCQAGLQGIAFGDLLIKQVAEKIANELPQITRFATLSPIPGLARWLAEQRGTTGERATALSPDECAVLDELDAAPWWTAPSDALRRVLPAATARYLLFAKSGRQPRDPVARFHLRNGARLARIYFLADPSPKGLAESHSMMVSYEYDERELLANHEAFMATGEIACSEEVRALTGE